MLRLSAFCIRHRARLGEAAQVDDELVRAGAVGAAEEHRVVVLQALGHVVGVQDGALGRLQKQSQKISTIALRCLTLHDRTCSARPAGQRT